MPEDAAQEIRRWLDFQDIIQEIFREREAQIAQWGDQVLPFGTGGSEYRVLADQYRRQTDEANAAGTVTFADVLLEEVFEALAEADPQKLRDELIQVAAVAVKVIQAIDKSTPVSADDLKAALIEARDAAAR
jgi:hypothetical protein